MHLAEPFGHRFRLGYFGPSLGNDGQFCRNPRSAPKQSRSDLIMMHRVLPERVEHSFGILGDGPCEVRADKVRI